MGKRIAFSLALFSAVALIAAQSAFAQSPQIRVNDQELQDGTVSVRQVVSDGPGWVVIHKQEGSRPGAVIGYAVVRDGQSRNVIVPVDTDNTTDTVYAMLHSDTGKLGTYDFPNGDPPVKVNNNVVVVPFDLTGGM